MKRWFALAVVLFAVFLFVYRQRVFLRDPLGSVTRDGMKEDGAQVFINCSNDVLIENDNAPMYVTLVQSGGTVGTPAALKCVHWMACMTDADPATLTAPMKHAKLNSMTARLVEFHDAQGRDVKVALR